MYYVFGAEYENNLTYYVSEDGMIIFKYDHIADMEYALDLARQTNSNFKAYNLVGEY